jgi:zinc protease
MNKTNQVVVSSVWGVLAIASVLAVSTVANAQQKVEPTTVVPPKVVPAKASAPSPTTATNSTAIKLPSGVKAVTSVEGINEYRLDNGLQVLLMPDQSKPTVTVNVTYKVGSRHENYGETGMAHLLEHLVFKGTPKFGRIDEEFNKRGARSNGTTWLDRTNYFELMQATDDNLKWAIEMEADRMVNSFIAKKDLDSEMTVVRNEYERGENNPFQVLIKRMQSMAFDWHSYGRSTIGNRSDIENVKIENLQAFYRTYYQPDNATLVIAGKFDEAQALTWIGQYFGAIKKPTRVLPPFWTTEPTQDGERSFTVRRKGDLQILIVGYKVPSSLHADTTALSIANFALTDTPTGRLHKALVETKKAQQVIGFPLTGAHPGLMLFGAVVKKDDPIEPVRDEILKIVEGLEKNPVTTEEVERAKRSFANSFEKTLNNHESTGIELSEYVALGDWRLFFQGRDLLANAKGTDAGIVASKYFRRDNRTVGMYLPEDQPLRAEVPATPSVETAMAGFKPKVAVAQAEAFDPSHENIDKRSKRVNIDGIKVVLLQKKTRGNAVQMQINFDSGNEQSLANKSYIGAMTSGLLMRGTTKFTRAQLADEMDRLKIAGGVSGFETTRENSVAAIELMAHVLRSPTFPETEFEQQKRQAITNTESQLNEPTAIASEALSKHFNQFPKGHPRYAASMKERIEGLQAVTLAEVKQHHADFYGASAGQISVVGDFDEQAITDAIRKSFSGWKSKSPFAPMIAPHKEVAAKVDFINTPDKENGMLVARLNIDMQESNPDYPAMLLINYMMGGGSGLNSRLAERIRQKEGLSYGVGSSLRVSAEEPAAFWFVQAIAAPQNLDKVEAALRDEIAKATKDGFTQAELDRAKSGTQQLALQSRAQDRNLAGALRTNEYFGRTMAYSKALQDKAAALTLAQVNAAFKKYIDASKLTIIKAGDKAKIK